MSPAERKPYIDRYEQMRKKDGAPQAQQPPQQRPEQQDILQNKQVTQGDEEKKTPVAQEKPNKMI
jgi:hypothetical protein